MLSVIVRHLMITFHIIQCHSQWISVSYPSLVRKLDRAACATYGDSIFLMGGTHSAHQWQDKLYVLTQDSLNVYVYNLASHFPNDVSLIPIGTILMGSGYCLAASQDFVFITGGYEVADVLSILTLSSNTWSDGPTLQYRRLDHNCVVVHDYLYIIGNTLENEKISIHNIQSKQWVSIGSLTERVKYSGTVVLKDIIWVVGGRIIGAAGTFAICDKVWKIDTSSGSVQLLSERLPHAMSEQVGAILIANNVLYAFGGEDTFQLHWMRYVPKETTEAPTAKPTPKPTSSPTNAATPTPTSHPTNKPTIDPSNGTHNIDPTKGTTTLPTQTPTGIVSPDKQTKLPTIESQQPTLPPVAYPSVEFRPSTDPTADHTSSTETKHKTTATFPDIVDSNTNGFSAKKNAIYILSLLGVCCCCCVSVLCYGCVRKKKKMRCAQSVDETKIDPAEAIQMKHLDFILSSPHNTIQSPDFIMHTLVRDDGEEKDDPKPMHIHNEEDDDEFTTKGIDAIVNVALVDSDHETEEVQRYAKESVNCTN
eukprot:308575_1